MRPHLAIPFTSLAATLALAGTAAAADVRFAAPDGDGPQGSCLLADPCSLANAVGFATDDDTIRVLDGTYELADSLDFFDDGVTMEPAVPGTRPVIRLDDDTAPALRVVVGGPNPGTVTIRGFAIENTSDITDSDAHPALQLSSPVLASDLVARSRGQVVNFVMDDPGASVLENSRIEQVAGTQRALLTSTGVGPGSVTSRRLTIQVATGGTGVHASGERTELLDSAISGGDYGVALVDGALGRRNTSSGAIAGLLLNGPATVTDSIATASGPGAKALSVAGAGVNQVRNVTAVATGAGSLGVATTGGATTLRNVIARGDATDIGVTGGTAAVDHSSFRTQTGIADGGANQGGDPQFVNAAAGDFRLAPTSPAIDAGIADDKLGATDLTGASRFQLAAPDLGAFEAVAKGAPQPPSAPAPVADVTAPALNALRASGKRRGAAKASFALGEAATVTVKLERRKAGKRKAGRCVKPSRKLRKAKRCTRFVAVATTRKSLAAGTASVKIGRKLAAGRYRVSVTATDAAGNRAKPATTAFRIKAR